ncbi:hypothetical protein LVD15_24695 [Fulvivirga maritima]|uniref:hypothetical protein n=1 Tax=Fulvivirga maritima TaxID=2904247 RepID=UPI001F22AB0B|nr:hypothetical protein [Fulvivirga maritima]UII26456.1 hypothetical protein LVD15_24695 [Fulvivirga maritima]
MSGRISLIFIALLILFFVVPNIFNNREKAAFSNEERLEKAKQKYTISQLGDSVTVSISDYYDRGSLATYFLGEHYRDIWHTEFTLPVLDIDTLKGGLQFEKIGGGQQTISADVMSKSGRAYTLRSVDKDQSKALPPILQYSLARPLFRDQTAALNPFGAIITASLEKTADILHTTPIMYFVPYDSSWNEEFQLNMSGRVVIMEEEPGREWVNLKNFNNAIRIIDSDELIPEWQSSKIEIDTRNYLKCRLFDMLINDWDRHEGQWDWAVYNRDNKIIAKPIATDRDMAFYNFNDGLLNKVALQINNKFQSFTPEYEDISGLIRNSKELDLKLLAQMSKADFIETAEKLQSTFTDESIDAAFSKYPHSIYTTYGKLHKKTFKQRLAKLDEAAGEFYDLLNAHD